MKVKRKLDAELDKAKSSKIMNDENQPVLEDETWKLHYHWVVESFFDKVDRGSGYTFSVTIPSDSSVEDGSEWTFILKVFTDKLDKRKRLSLIIENDDAGDEEYRSIQFTVKAQILDKEKLPMFSFSRRQIWSWDSYTALTSFVTLEELHSRRLHFDANGNLSLDLYLSEVRDYLNITNDFDLMSSSSASSNSTMTFKRMLDRKIFTDMSIKTKEQIFSCHKAVLASASPFFSAMLNSDMKENKESLLDLSGIIDGETVDDMLNFIYTDEAPNIEKTCEKLLLASDMYNLVALKQACQKEVSKKINVENAAYLLQLAIKHHAQLLKKNTIVFISSHSDDVMASVGWNHMPEDVLRSVLNSFVALVNVIV